MNATRSMVRLSDFQKANPVCFWKGNKRVAEVAHAEALVPASGVAKDWRVDRYRTMVNLHHDVYTNGAGNATDPRVSVLARRQQFGVSASGARNYSNSPEMLEAALDKALDDVVSKYPLEQDSMHARLRKQQDADFDFIKGLK